MIMNIFVAVWGDRHSDTTVHLFTDKQKAIDWARETAKSRARRPEDYEEPVYSREDGWVFYATYSCEDDGIYVVESEIDKELAVEDLEAAHLWLDDKGVPRFDKETEAEYSLVGRIIRYKEI